MKKPNFIRAIVIAAIAISSTKAATACTECGGGAYGWNNLYRPASSYNGAPTPDDYCSRAVFQKHLKSSYEGREILKCLGDPRNYR